MGRLFLLLQGLHGAVGILFGIASFAFCIWMAYDCVKRNGDGYWIYLILFTGGIFAVVYFFTQYWHGSRMEYGMWRWFTTGHRIRELRARAKQLNTSHAYELLGDALYGAGQFAEAESAYREALARDPNSFDAKVSLGYALVAQEKMDEAWPLLGKAYQEKPDYDNYHLIWNLARCQAQRGKYEDARNLFEFFLGKHGYSEARIEYAQVLKQMGAADEGKAALEELLAEIEASPRYSRSRERPWSRSAKRLLREWSSGPEEVNSEQ
jgi:hypothetical protein